MKKNGLHDPSEGLRVLKMIGGYGDFTVMRRMDIEIRFVDLMVIKYVIGCRVDIYSSLSSTFLFSVDLDSYELTRLDLAIILDRLDLAIILDRLNLFPPLDNPKLTIRRRSRTDPTILSNSEMAAEGNGDLPVPDLQTMKELCQPSLKGRGGPIAPNAIQAMNFGLKNDMIQKVHNSCQFHGLPGNDANKHLDKFLHVTQSIKVIGATDDALHLYLFPHSLTRHATAWFDRLPRNSINTFEQMAKMFLGKYFPPSMVTKLRNEITNFHQCPDESLFEAWERYKLSIDRCPNHNMLPVTQIDTFYNSLTLRHRDTINAAAGGTFMIRRPEECYDLIENMTAHHNDWDTSAQWSESSSSITSSSDTEIAALKAKMAKINKKLMRVLQVNKQVKAVTPNCETYGGPHSFSDCPAIVGNTQNIPQPQVVTTNEFTNFMKANDVILKNMHTNMTSLTNSNLKLKNMFGQFMKMNTALSSGSGTLPGNTITNPKKDLKGITTLSGTVYQGPMIPTTSSSSLVVERETEATKDMVHPTNNESTKDVQPPIVPTESPILNSEPVNSPIIELVASPDLNFNISFVDALILMPKFGPSIKSLLTNKDKLCKLARTPLNEHCSVVLLKKLQEKLEDPGKFLIPCDFPGMAKCLALADLGTSINLIPLSMWNKLSLLDLSPTCMTLELTDRSISHPVGVAKDVFVKVGTFHFPADFVVIDFDADPRVPLILRRSFLKTERALIYVFECELALRVGKEAITFNLDQTSRYLANYNEMTANRIDVIDMACEDDFLLEEVDAFLAFEDDPTSPEVDQSYEKTTFTCPYRMFAYRRMPVGLCNAPGTFQRFIQDFSKIARPMTRLLEKDTPFFFSKEHVEAFQTLKRKLTEAPILIAPDWDLPFELMCDASDFAIGAVLGQRQEKHFRLIHYANKTMTEAESNYTTTEKEMLDVVYAFENSGLISS
uniref:Reverse transcriptase domain-containing protein n=1 Tax=Tanacetum cinerariifolium TaxID=118510 RepID=A0A6L2MY06_TANCI|nr:reverse transcriptase domain-containing protein [Tanacetum cinerariifolium]